jgi:hypothetical protein
VRTRQRRSTAPSACRQRVSACACEEGGCRAVVSE